MIDPAKRRYRCSGCGYESKDERDAEDHQCKCDNAMELIK
jgi:DNA-directed RNA polymerase subunit RPC12/RpoP